MQVKYFDRTLFDCEKVNVSKYWNLFLLQGLNIFRFANRIPLLFEQGADVVTRTALKRIKYEWNHLISPFKFFSSFDRGMNLVLAILVN